MTTGFFGDIKPVKYEGPDSTNPLAYYKLLLAVYLILKT